MENAREGQRKKGLLFEVEGMQGSSFPMTEKAHRLLKYFSEPTSCEWMMMLPLGFGEVSMVYNSFMLLISYK